MNITFLQHKISEKKTNSFNVHENSIKIICYNKPCVAQSAGAVECDKSIFNESPDMTLNCT